MKKIHIIACLILLLLGVPHLSTAGTLSSDLGALSQTDTSDEPIPVLILLPAQKNTITLKEELVSLYATRAERHYHGMIHLQQKAAIDQKDMLNELRQMETAGLAANIKSHWIINAVTANIAVSELEKLASRKDLLEVRSIPEAVGIVPPDQSYHKSDFLKTADSMEWNIKAIGADSAWSLGYTGAGRLVCSFDTGVKGVHPALINGWKGHDGDSAAAWFDPIYGESFPHYIADAGNYPWHGTHTMGTMVGIDNATGDTIGVAPEAKWIAAGVIDVPGASIIDAFEWAADPDGDPNTIGDVPDVINHSWGISNDDFGCNDYFWAMIDNTEALGIVNIFAAGNDGAAESISNPANRPECFAVGALDSITSTDTLIADFSSLGPSDCDGTTIKPDVVAPGVAIRSSYYIIDYYVAGGTSMASPHVAGAVALLRQASPDATVDEIKQALKDGCIPLGVSSPNDTMGYGLINIPAAIEALTPISTSDLWVAGFNHGNPDPGASVSIPVYVTNKGTQLTDVYGIISGGTGKITYSAEDDSLYFGTVGPFADIGGHIDFAFQVVDTVTPGSMITLDFTLHGSGDYVKATKLYIQVGDMPEQAYYTHNTGRVQFTLSNFGQYGFSTDSFVPLGYSGFTFDGVNCLYEATFMVASDADHVSDAGRNVFPEPDNDFKVAPGGELITSAPGPYADQETVCAFDDSKAENPIGVEIRQKSFSWNTAPDDQYVILEFEITNVSGGTLNNLYAGMYLNWDPYEGIIYTTAHYSAADELGYLYYSRIGINERYRGISVINDEGTASYSIVKMRKVNGSFVWESYPETEKFSDLTSGITTDSLNGYDSLDLAHVISTGPFSLTPGQSDTAVFALVAADDLAGLKAVATNAYDKYQITLDVETVDPGVLPERFTLHQNYPNPFNPSTEIAFSLARRATVELTIYNLLGEQVTKLVNRELPAGVYKTNWNGTDGDGKSVASGVYFYRLSFDGSARTRKMLLLK